MYFESQALGSVYSGFGTQVVEVLALDLCSLTLTRQLTYLGSESSWQHKKGNRCCAFNLAAVSQREA